MSRHKENTEQSSQQEWLPVAQKVQPIWQPTCDDTQSVDLCWPSTAWPSSLSSSPERAVQKGGLRDREQATLEILSQ